MQPVVMSPPPAPAVSPPSPVLTTFNLTTEAGREVIANRANALAGTNESTLVPDKIAFVASVLNTVLLAIKHNTPRQVYEKSSIYTNALNDANKVLAKLPEGEPRTRLKSLYTKAFQSVESIVKAELANVAVDML